ncbi:MAG: two-component system, LuxR family, response regulator FixJ [Sphingomonadales bacterium]|jgi:two-component system response regulator FixJ|nr:two-component system, LuxR family, response regulator FixJ [Sphingomonadales bacterium]
MGERRAYIIDDERLLRALVRQAVAEFCTVVEEYESAESFLVGHSDRPAGCIIVDINLPGINGLDLLEVIARGRAAYPVVVVSANGNVPHAVRAGRLGVVDFIEKPFRIDQLLSAVQKGFELLESGPMSRISALGTLTRREKEVLVSFADGAPNKVVAYSLGLSVRTVELHRANMMKKLGVRSLSQALLIAKDGGYV